MGTGEAEVRGGTLEVGHFRFWIAELRRRNHEQYAGIRKNIVVTGYIII
jgi:hypothetical protein